MATKYRLDSILSAPSNDFVLQKNWVEKEKRANAGTNCAAILKSDWLTWTTPIKTPLFSVVAAHLCDGKGLLGACKKQCWK